jgi:hypothetical protein
MEAQAYHPSYTGILKQSTSAIKMRSNLKNSYSKKGLGAFL